MNDRGITLVIHNVGSVQRLLDTVKAAVAFDNVRLIVVSKPYGAAAQAGVPEAQKIIFKRGRGFMVLPDLGDVVELLHPDKIYTVSWDHGRRVNSINVEGDTMIIVGATDPGLTRQEAMIGEPIYPAGPSAPMGPVAEAALILGMIDGYEG